MTTTKKIKGINNLTKLGIGGGAILGATLERRKAMRAWEEKCFEARLKGEPPPAPPKSILPYITGAFKGAFIGGISAKGANYISKLNKDGSTGSNIAAKSLAAAPLAIGLLKEGIQNRTSREKLKYETLSQIERDKIAKEKQKEEMELRGRNDKIKTELNNQAKAKLQEYKLAKYKEKLRYKLAKKGIKMDFSYLIDNWIDIFIANFDNAFLYDECIANGHNLIEQSARVIKIILSRHDDDDLWQPHNLEIDRHQASTIIEKKPNNIILYNPICKFGFRFDFKNKKFYLRLNENNEEHEFYTRYYGKDKNEFSVHDSIVSQLAKRWFDIYSKEF